MSEITWQKVCTQATILIPEDVDIVKTGLLTTLQKDFEFMKDNVALVRVSALPLGSSIEIEMNCDTSRFESGKLDKVWKNEPR